MQTKNTLDELLKQQFQHDTERASVDLPSSHMVMLRSKISAMVGVVAGKQRETTRSAHVIVLVAQWVLVFMFLFAMASFIPSLGGGTSTAKIIALGSIVVAWLMDRFE